MREKRDFTVPTFATWTPGCYPASECQRTQPAAPWALGAAPEEPNHRCRAPLWGNTFHFTAHNYLNASQQIPPTKTHRCPRRGFVAPAAAPPHLSEPRQPVAPYLRLEDLLVDSRKVKNLPRPGPDWQSAKHPAKLEPCLARSSSPVLPGVEGGWSPACQSRSSLISVPGGDESAAGEPGLVGTAVSSHGHSSGRDPPNSAGMAACRVSEGGEVAVPASSHPEGLAAAASRGISGPLSSTRTINCDTNAAGRTVPRGKKKLFLYSAYLNSQITNVLMYTPAHGWPRDKEAFRCLGGRASYEDNSLSGSHSFPLLLKPLPCRPSGICLDLPGSSKRACTHPCTTEAVSVTTLFQ